MKFNIGNNGGKKTVGKVTADIKVDGKLIPEEYQLVSININKEINKIPFAKITFLEGGTVDNEQYKISNSGTFTTGGKCNILLGYDTQTDSVFEGIIVKKSIKIGYSGRFIYTVECRDAAFMMTLGRKSIVFTEKKDSDIISDLIGNYSGLSADVESTSLQYPEIVQHYTSDWDFMMLRAELNGMVVIPEANTICVSKIDSLGKNSHTTGIGDGLYSYSAEMDARTQYPGVSGLAWDMDNLETIDATGKKPKEPKIGKETAAAMAKVGSLKEYKLQSAGNLPMQAIQGWTDAVYAKSALSKVLGTAVIQGDVSILPGDELSIENVGDEFSGTALISAVEHRVEDGQFLTHVNIGLKHESYAEVTPRIDAPGASGIISPIKGLHTAIVKQLDQDPQAQHRILVDIPTLDTSSQSIWARLATFYASNGFGNFFIPEIGDEVIVGFVNEDPQFPVILGSLYGKKNVPPLTAEADNFYKSIVTKSMLKINFDDDKKIISIETPGGNIVTMDDDQKLINITDMNGNSAEFSGDGIVLNTGKDIKLTATGDISLEATGNVNLKATGDAVVEGLNVECTSTANFTAKGAMTELNGSGQTTVKGGIVMIN